MEEKRVEVLLSRRWDFDRVVAFLGLIVFIDDTQVVNKGNRTSKPVVLALANMRGQIRQKEVRACVV